MALLKIFERFYKAMVAERFSPLNAEKKYIQPVDFNDKRINGLLRHNNCLDFYGDRKKSCILFIKFSVVSNKTVLI